MIGTRFKQVAPSVGDTWNLIGCVRSTVDITYSEKPCCIVDFSSWHGKRKDAAEGRHRTTRVFAFCALQLLNLSESRKVSDDGMENSGESGDDGGPLGPTAFLGGAGVSATYIGVQSDDLEDDPENTDDSNHGAGDAAQGGGGGSSSGGPLREQDRFLPIANVAKIMKRAIPEAGKIAKDARECVQECVSEFISFITSEASDRCHMEKRKTINGEDILFAMTTLGFDNYVEPLKVYLQKYREATKGDNPTNPSGGTTIVGGNGKQEAQGTIYEDQLFAIAATASSSAGNTTETPVIYSYSSIDQMQFQLT